ncbi:radical SAM protein [Candidatus Woesearchaeota archaeon]|nr:radical SAM protein [Candidatus Woesearchaeota archaeon]
MPSEQEYIKNIRILLTERCNMNCPHCFNKDSRNLKDMDSDKLIRLLDYLSNHIDSIKIMGGEPTIHPDFLKLYNYAQKKIRSIDLFSNGSNDNILNIKPREKDGITYNLDTLNDNFNYLKFFPESKCKIHFETMLGNSTIPDNIFSKIKKIMILARKRKVEDKIRFNVTLDCVENIFDNKDELNKKWVYATDFILSINPSLLKFDHCIPLCFWKKESLDFIKEKKLGPDVFVTCRPGCYGLINSDFELLHCNQFPVKITDIFKSEEKNSPIISFNKLNTLLFKFNMHKLNINLNNGVCVDCKYAILKCTGGCFMHKYPRIN